MDDFLTPGQIDPKLKHAYEEIPSTASENKDFLKASNPTEYKPRNDELSNQILQKQDELKTAYEKSIDNQNQEDTTNYVPSPNDFIGSSNANKESSETEKRENNYLISPSSETSKFKTILIIFGIILFFVFYTLVWGKYLNLF